MKKLMILLSLMLTLVIVSKPIQAESIYSYVIDHAQIFKADELEKISSQLAKIGEDYNTNVFAAYVYSIYDADIEDYAFNLLNERLDGFEKNKEGTMLLVVLDSQEYIVVSDPYAAKVINNTITREISAAIQPHLSDGNYAQAITEYGTKVETAYKNHGKVAPTIKKKKDLFSVKRLAISAVLGSLLALFMASRNKGQLKSVVKQHTAKSYLVKSDLKKGDDQDVFLFEKVTKQPKEKKAATPTKKASSKGKF